MGTDDTTLNRTDIKYKIIQKGKPLSQKSNNEPTDEIVRKKGHLKTSTSMVYCIKNTYTNSCPTLSWLIYVPKLL